MPVSLTSIVFSCSSGSVNEVYQKVVRISPNGRQMATGGCDGSISLWHFPTLKPLRTIKAHKNEVDDLDFSPDSQKVYIQF